MADGPKIVPDPAPAEPFDVPITPDPPPPKPFDVPTYPDPGPGGTFDVPVSLDSPPREPQDVPTFVDPPPANPFDVPVALDPAPRVPFDVPTSPDGPPRAPFEVPLSLDPPPAAPFDVQTAPDGPPAAPFDVNVTPDSPPAVPFDVAVTPDGPPADPFNVGIALDPPPAEPFDVGITLSPPPVLLEGGSSTVPTIQAIINAVKRFDHTLGNFLSTLVQVEPFQMSVQGAGALDPTFLASWFRDYTQAVGPGAVARFMAEQTLLFAMNPIAARVFDPLYFIKMMVPGSMGHAHATLDTQLGDTAEVQIIAKDKVLQATAFLAVDVASGQNTYTPDRRMTDGQEFSLDEMVDSAIGGTPNSFMTQQRDEAGIPLKKFDASKFFQSRESDGRQLVRPEVKARIGIENVQSREAELAASNFVGGIVRMSISPKEDPDGAVYSRTADPSDVVHDDETRIPVCFTDLRKDPVRNAYRSVFFRPLNLSFSKSIQPDWQEGSAFGRVDPIVSYKSTQRSYSVSFDLHAFAPEDLEVMYRKMTWLDSMCYPTYGSDSLMKSGPVTRMRIGDAVSTGAGGLTGIIKSLNFDFAEALWELKAGYKVPRSFKVSLEFTALHEGPVGLVNGAFGVFKLPPTKNGSDTLKNFQNYVQPDHGIAGQSQDQPPKGSQILPGMYSKFGEPRRK